MASKKSTTPKVINLTRENAKAVRDHIERFVLERSRRFGDGYVSIQSQESLLTLLRPLVELPKPILNRLEVELLGASIGFPTPLIDSVL